MSSNEANRQEQARDRVRKLIGVIKRSGELRLKDAIEIINGDAEALKNPRQTAKYAMTSIVDAWNDPTIRSIRDGLACPTPGITYEDETLRFPVRPFSKELWESDEIAGRLRRLAHHVARSDLIPQKSSVFLGNGTTVYWVARAIMDSYHDHHLTISTENLEIVILLYLRSMALFNHHERHLYLGGRAVDWGTGCVGSENSVHYDTAVISCHSIKKEGKFFSRDENTLTSNNNAIRRAQDTVILVADRRKFGRAVKGPGEIDLAAVGTTKRVILVTDHQPSDEFNLPPSIEVKVFQDEVSSSSSVAE